MAHTDNTDPFRIRYPDGWPNHLHLYSDSGFRKHRKWLKRQRSKKIRRSDVPNLKRTWDFY